MATGSFFVAIRSRMIFTALSHSWSSPPGTSPHSTHHVGLASPLACERASCAACSGGMSILTAATSMSGGELTPGRKWAIRNRKPANGTSPSSRWSSIRLASGSKSARRVNLGWCSPTVAETSKLCLIFTSGSGSRCSSNAGSPSIRETRCGPADPGTPLWLPHASPCGCQPVHRLPGTHSQTYPNGHGALQHQHF
jgi:hypothetical protein